MQLIFNWLQKYYVPINDKSDFERAVPNEG